MRIYRCLTARELTNMYKNINEKNTALVFGENTHEYKNSEYIHFFRYSESAEFYFNNILVSNFSLDKYIAYMVANVPNEILEQYLGYGFYNYTNELFDKDTIPIPEYAIPKELFKSEYVVEVNKYISYEYKSNHDEYDSYLNLINELLEKHDYNFYTVANFLKQNSLEELLNIEIDDRTEEQFIRDREKEFKKTYNGLY